MNANGHTAVAYSFYPKTSGLRGSAYMILAREVDSLFLARFIDRLQHSSNFDDYLTHESEAEAAQRQLQQDIERDMKAVKSLMVKLKRRLTLLTVDDEDESEEDTSAE